MATEESKQIFCWGRSCGRKRCVRKIYVSRAGDKALMRETPAQRGRVNRYDDIVPSEKMNELFFSEALKFDWTQIICEFSLDRSNFWYFCVSLFITNMLNEDVRIFIKLRKDEIKDKYYRKMQLLQNMYKCLSLKTSVEDFLKNGMITNYCTLC